MPYIWTDASRDNESREVLSRLHADQHLVVPTTGTSKLATSALASGIAVAVRARTSCGKFSQVALDHRAQPVHHGVAV